MCTANIYEQLQASRPKEGGPKSVPLGSGMAHDAKLRIMNRRRKVDEAVRGAQR